MPEGDDQDQDQSQKKDPAVEALKAKNEELIGEIRALRDKLRGFGDLTPEEAAEAKRKAKAAEEAELSAKGQYEELKKRLQSEHSSEVEKLRGQIAERDQRLHKLLVQDELARAFDEAGVLPDAREYVRAYFLTQSVKVAESGAVIERSDGDKPLRDAVLEWAKSDKADRFVEGRSPNGSGSRKKDDGAGGKSWTDMTETERAKLYRSDKAEAERLASQAGARLP